MLRTNQHGGGLLFSCWVYDPWSALCHLSFSIHSPPCKIRPFESSAPFSIWLPKLRGTWSGKVGQSFHLLPSFSLPSPLVYPLLAASGGELKTWATLESVSAGTRLNEPLDTEVLAFHLWKRHFLGWSIHFLRFTDSSNHCTTEEPCNAYMCFVGLLGFWG